MKAIRGGHTPACKGASGFLDETTEVRALKDRVIELLSEVNETVLDCTPPATISNVNEELSYGTNTANNSNAELYIPFHMNAGGGYGSECWVYDSSSTQAIEVSNKILDNLNRLGFKNRGVKFNKEYHDLRSTKMESLILEVCFVDNQQDFELYKTLGIDRIARAIANALNSNVSLEPKKREIDYLLIGTFNSNNNLVKVIQQLEHYIDKYHCSVEPIIKYAGAYDLKVYIDAKNIESFTYEYRVNKEPYDLTIIYK